MDYVRPIETLIPGVQGRILTVLTRNESEMTIRAVARLAGVSPQQASVVTAELVNLGIVSRREAGSSALVCLDRENEAARIVLTLARLLESVIGRLSELATDISPAPESLIVFGSFARGETTSTGDLDVLVVRAKEVAANDNEWIDALGVWERTARRVVGNPVNMMVVSADEVPALVRRHSGPWRAIANEGVVLVGRPLTAFTRVA
ncbi:MAG TPA: DUF294 nucleotidyltransferase-like domain-containing protein [Acidimicrobiales bacterium]|nr:DUF294 nucleotidyltransferase-like domain-containing protein [Acidimicrobiales bacterium]